MCSTMLLTTVLAGDHLDYYAAARRCIRTRIQDSAAYLMVRLTRSDRSVSNAWNSNGSLEEGSCAASCTAMTFAAEVPVDEAFTAH